MQILRKLSLYTHVIAKLDKNCYYKCKCYGNCHCTHTLRSKWTKITTLNANNNEIIILHIHCGQIRHKYFNTNTKKTVTLHTHYDQIGQNFIQMEY